MYVRTGYELALHSRSHSLRTLLLVAQVQVRRAVLSRYHVLYESYVVRRPTPGAGIYFTLLHAGTSYIRATNITISISRSHTRSSTGTGDEGSLQQ